MITVKNNVFKIDTPQTSYIFRVLPSGHLQNLHYGRRLSDNFDITALCDQQGTGQGTAVARLCGKEKLFVDNVCLENSTNGRGDFREPMVLIRDGGGSTVNDFLFDSWRFVENFIVPSLPNSTGKVQTLAVVLKDVKQLTQTLYYSVFDDCDIIVKSTSLTNDGNNTVFVERLFSGQLDLPSGDFILDTLDGTWARERYINSAPLRVGTTNIDSKRGISSNTHNPYIVLKETNTTYDNGGCFGINLVYSGNHREIVEKTVYNKVRVLSGINDFGFCWHLGAGQTFFTPENTLCFSHAGTNGLTQNYHKFVNNHIVRGQWQNKPRPVLINNWEATYFNFTEKKLLEIAKKAKSLGLELFVLDDGWFGDRTNDTKGLGDWYVNKKRLEGGLDGLAKKIKALGLDFGIWVEPEMVNPDSDLYRKHPDWAVTHPDYSPCLCRNQLLLDFSNEDVCKYIVDSMTDVFSSAEISYVKWDFNRPITDFYSPKLLGRQGEFLHRYMLGFYSVLKTLTEKFPHMLFESCASGGNRVDLGILCYMPQYWASDNTDSFDRQKIQEGTLACYPQSTMGCHVSASPNHQTLRTSQIDNRFNTASLGVLGYELDLSELSRIDTDAVKEQIEFYKTYRNTLQFGTYFRLNSVFGDGRASWIVVNDDKSQAVAAVFNGVAETIPRQEILKTRGLDDNFLYQFKTRRQQNSIKSFGSLINMVSPVHIKNDGKLQEFLDNNINLLKGEEQCYVLGGDVLNYAGVKLFLQWSSTGLDGSVRVMGDFGGRLYTINKVKQ